MSEWLMISLAIAGALVGLAALFLTLWWAAGRQQPHQQQRAKTHGELDDEVGASLKRHDGTSSGGLSI